MRPASIAPAFLGALRAALDTYRNPKLWQKLMLNGMSQDYSWGASAAKYAQLYEGLLASRQV